MSKELLPDDLLKESLRKAQEMKTSVYERKMEKSEKHVFSEEYRIKIKILEGKLEDEKESNIRNHTVKKKSLKLKILLIAAIVMLMGSMTVLAVEPLREVFYQLIENIFTDHTDVSFKEIEEHIDSKGYDINLDAYPLKLQRVPDGYVLIMEDDSKEFGFYEFIEVYQNEDNQTLVYTQKRISELDYNSWSITSDGTRAEKIHVCGEVAYLLADDEEYHTILYAKEGFAYMLGGYDDVKVLVDCLETAFSIEE